MTDTMRRWEMDGIGRDELQLRSAPVPVPGAGQVLARVHAVSLNHRDKMVIDNGRGLPLSYPFTPGSDLAGTVAALGDDATRFEVGDRVISTFTPGWIDGRRRGDARTPSYRTLGGYYPGVLADYVALPEDWLGADHVLDRRREDWVEAVLGITDDHGADHVLELVGGSHLGVAVQIVAVGGHIHQIGALAGFDVSAPAMPLMLKDVTIHGIGTGHRRALEDLVSAVDRTHLVPVIDTRYPLADLPAAIDHVERGAFGKVVVELE